MLSERGVQTPKMASVHLPTPVLVTVCVAVFSSAAAADVAHVHFREAGSVGVPCAYGHLTFALEEQALRARFEVMQDHLLSSFARSIAAPHKKCDPHKEKHCSLHDLHDDATMDHVYMAELQGIERSTRRVVDEMRDMVFRGKQRDKRFIETLLLGAVEVINFGLTLKNSADIAVFKTKLATLETRMQALVQLDDQILKTQARDHRAIEKLMNVSIRLDRAVSENRRAAVFLGYRTAMEEVLAEAKEMCAALGVLHHGVVSTALLNFTQLTAAYDKFKILAKTKNLEAVFPRPDVLLGAHASFWVEGRTLRFAIPVPLVSARSKELLKAYRLEDEPTSVPDLKGMQLLYSSPHRYIVVSHERSAYYALTAEEWANCNGFGDVTFCPEVRLRRDNFGSTCIGALYDGSPRAAKLCGVLIRRAPALVVREDKPGSVLVTSTTNRTAQWRTRCEGVPTENFTTVGPGTVSLRVPEGCMAYGEEHAYINLPKTVVFETRLRRVPQPDVGLPAVLAAFDNWTHVEEVFNATITETEAGEYHDASVLAETLARRRLEELERHASTVSSYGFGTLIAVIVVLAGVAALALWTAAHFGVGLRNVREGGKGDAARLVILERRATEAEERVAAAEQKATAAERRAEDAENKTVELRTELPSYVRALEAEASQSKTAQQQAAAQAASQSARSKKKSAASGSTGNLLGD